MGSLRYIALAVLAISGVTFITFFGRLPALRHTLIGSLHRGIWIRLPRVFRSIDQRLTRGAMSAWISRQAYVLWNDRHPLVMLFFMTILIVAEGMFLPQAWSLMSTTRKVNAVITVSLPWIFLYLSAITDPGYITPENHSYQMSLYPYDFTIFYPGHSCRTCHLLKPARSKHCSICKRCIAKADHHCIFINNCVGYSNQHYFLLLLFSTGILTSYATYVGASLMSATIRAEIPSWTLLGKGFSWSQYWNILAWALQGNICIGAVSLLTLLTSPLVWGLLGYHIYLIWAGTTTNESLKWSDWQAEMADGYVFKRSLDPNRSKDLRIESRWSSWPVTSEQIVQRTEDGMPPRGDGADVGFGDWERVWKLSAVENLYDLGFRDNLVDIFAPRKTTAGRGY